MSGKIPIADAATIAKKRGCQIVLVFGVDDGGERFSVTTYGLTPKLCKVAASLGEQFAKAVMDGAVAPAEEPDGPGVATQVEYRRSKHP